MKRIFTLVLVCFLLITKDSFSQNILFHFDQTSPQQQYAFNVLAKLFHTKRDPYSKSIAVDYRIVLVINPQLSSESFTIQPNNKTITITGGDERGLIYGCFSLAEDVHNGIALKDCKPKNEKPFLPFRAIKFDLPWDTYRHSYALELHDQTCRDTNYWRSFLDMMAENRLNTLTLWNLHPYTFLIKPKNFPEASPWTDEEMKAWQTLFHSITRMAMERAIDVYIIPFNIFVTPEFAKAHHVAMDNLDHNYFVRGDTSAIIKQYTKECVTQMLDEYPGITGIGLTLGEGMAGMTAQQREDWMKETIIAGMRAAKRKSKLIHRIPFSSTTGSLGITSIETEKLTRKAIEEEAAMGFTEGPIWADLKFNWSHAHATTKMIKTHGGKLFDTYFKPEPTEYKIVWTARNEDFFCLRWGVPSFVREHILQNFHSWSGGYIIGSETYIPAKDYFTKDNSVPVVSSPAKHDVINKKSTVFPKKSGRHGGDTKDSSVSVVSSPARHDVTKSNSTVSPKKTGRHGGDTHLPWHYAFERQWLFYKLWGRLLYDPHIKDDVFNAEFIRRYGNKGKNLLMASSLAGSTALRIASAFDCGWDFTLYTEGMMALDTTTKKVEYISVDRLIHQPTLDSDYISIKDWVDHELLKNSFAKNKITPPMLATMLEQDCNKALALVKNINPANDKALQQEVADIKAWAFLGLHFAEKLRGAVLLQLYRNNADETFRRNAVQHLQKALVYWDSIIAITRPLYNDMPLVHLSQQGGSETKENFYLSFHWAKLRKDVEKDIEIAREAKVEKH